jgi:hypothetical protein
LTAKLKAGTSSMSGLIRGGLVADDAVLTKPALSKAKLLLTQARGLLAPGADSPDVSANRRASVGSGVAAGAHRDDGAVAPTDTDHLRGMVMDYFQTHKGASQAAMKDHLLAMVRKGAGAANK